MIGGDWQGNASILGQIFFSITVYHEHRSKGDLSGVLREDCGMEDIGAFTIIVDSTVRAFCYWTFFGGGAHWRRLIL